MYNTVIHNKLQLSRFDSVGFRWSFELVSEGKFVLARQKHASKITQLICDESRDAVIKAFAEQTKKRKVALALDCWSKKLLKFLALTGHFVERPDWIYQAPLLGCSELNKGETSDGKLV
jgi:hypothetical protein